MKGSFQGGYISLPGRFCHFVCVMCLLSMQPLKLDHKILYRATDDGYIAFLVHQPWLSLDVKLAYRDKVWETL